MTHLHEFENRPIKLQNKILEKVLDIAQYAQLTSEEKNEYEDSLKTYNDLKNTLDTAENKGYLKAEELFLPQIEEERRQKEEERRQKEEERRQKEEERRQKELLFQKQRKLILKMLSEGESQANVAAFFEISEAELAEIIKE